MPVLTSSGPPAVSDLAGQLVSDLAAGRAARQTFGSRSAAFEWSTGLPMILGRQVTSAVVDGLTFTAVRVAPSGTPAAKVAAGAQKPAGTTITTDQESLTKYAGLASFQTEQALQTDALVPALASVLSTSCLMAYDADCAAVLAADAGLDATGTDWPSAILAGIAAVAGAGGAPGVLVLSAADYAAAVQSPGTGYAMNPADGVPSLFGLAIVLMGGVATGTGYVLDPAAALAVENTSSPMAVVDPYSGLGTNEVRLAVEWFAGFVVTSPGAVCQLTVTAVGTQSSGGGGTGSDKRRSDFALGA